MKRKRIVKRVRESRFFLWAANEIVKTVVRQIVRLPRFFFSVVNVVFSYSNDRLRAVIKLSYAKI